MRTNIHVINLRIKETILPLFKSFAIAEVREDSGNWIWNYLV